MWYYIFQIQQFLIIILDVNFLKTVTPNSIWHPFGSHYKDNWKLSAGSRIWKFTTNNTKTQKWTSSAINLWLYAVQWSVDKSQEPWWKCIKFQDRQFCCSWLTDSLCRWDETSQNRSNPKWYVSVESHGDHNAGCEKLLTHPPECSGNHTSRVIWEQVQGMDEGVRIFSIQYMKHLKGYLTCCTILWHGASSFTSNLREGVLQIFIILKNPLPLPGLKPWSMGPVASTLTTIPPRWQLCYSYFLYSHRLQWTMNPCACVHWGSSLGSFQFQTSPACKSSPVP
jgi:hypothetical protein